MRTITKEHHERLMKECPVYATIMNTPKPDFTNLHRLNLEFEQWLAKEQEKDRKICQGRQGRTLICKLH